MLQSFQKLIKKEMTSFEQGIQTITHKLVNIIFTPIMWILTGAAMVLFFYGIAVFLFNSDEAEKNKGKWHMVYGTIGLFIIFAV